jgi:thiol:disulfide interchange protein DsbD
VWLSIAVLATLYLLGTFRLTHDSPIENLGVMRMLSAMTFLAVGFYLFTGLIGGSLGTLEAFLPPRNAGGLALTGSGARGPELTWHTNLKPALEQARATQKPIFIDFTGYTCTNCRWMEANIFPLPAVHAELEKYVRVQLYTDGWQHTKNVQRYKRTIRYGGSTAYAIPDPRGNKIATSPV